MIEKTLIRLRNMRSSLEDVLQRDTLVRLYVDERDLEALNYAIEVLEDENWRHIADQDARS